MVKKIRLLSSAAAMLLMGSMTLLVYAKQRDRSVQEPPVQEPQPATLSAGIAEETEETETEYPVPSYPVVELALDPVEPVEAEIRLEAEDCTFSGQLAVEDSRSGYSGEGYLAGFSQTPGDAVSATFTVPASQHYDVTISVCADMPVTNALLLNDERIGEFTIDETEHFVRVTFSGVYIPAGEAKLSIEEMDGFFSLDYFELTNYDEMYEIRYDRDYQLSDPEASDGAKKLMRYLSRNYGRKTITGQHCAGELDSEMDLIYHMTGKYPAIRFGDVESYSANSTFDGGDVIGACERWAERGGIVGLMWHWDAPSGVSSVYAEEADFSLLDALPPYKVINDIVENNLLGEDATEPEEDAEPTAPPKPTDAEDHAEGDETEATGTTPSGEEDEESWMDAEFVQRFEFTIDVALMDPEEIRQAVDAGDLSEACAALIEDIDTVSKTLKPLAEKDIPVLWRPLHEAGGDWFWWGADGVEPYRWLWDTMYRRMTEYHGLHNLIWIWNGQSEDYLVDQYDIASLDLYLAPEKTFGSRYEQFVSLSRMTEGKKLLALSECSAVPDVNMMFRDNTVWSYFGLWYGDYIVDEKGRYSEKFTNAEQLVSVYNSEAAITLDDAASILKS